jgi:predicted DCC family thiol-disulfide oxidoreductase YuxK
MAWVLFYDGDCAFCSSSVRRVLKLDRSGQIDFAPLKGKLSQAHGFSKVAETMILFRESDGKTFTHSDGLIQLARIFGGAWWIFTLARFIPKPLRDWVYRSIARNRYRIMGKNDHCALPDPELLKRLRE